MHLSFISFKYFVPSVVLRCYYITAIIMPKIGKYQQEISSTVSCKIFQKVSSEDCHESMEFIPDLALQNDCSLLDIKRKISQEYLQYVRSPRPRWLVTERQHSHRRAPNSSVCPVSLASLGSNRGMVCRYFPREKHVGILSFSFQLFLFLLFHSSKLLPFCRRWRRLLDFFFRFQNQPTSSL